MNQSDYLPLDSGSETFVKLRQQVDREKYVPLCRELVKDRYAVVNFSEALSLLDRNELRIEDKVRIVWVHDVERPHGNWISLGMAQVEQEFGLASTFFPRVYSFDSVALRDPLLRIEAMPRHEVGYQYEELTTTNGDMKAARDVFLLHLNRIREKGFAIWTLNSHGVWRAHINAEKMLMDEAAWDTDFLRRAGILDNGECCGLFLNLLKNRFPGKVEYYGETRFMGREFLAALKGTSPDTIVLLLNHSWLWSDLYDEPAFADLTRIVRNQFEPEIFAYKKEA
ncbi:MAG: hypothetical protein KAT86_05435 [Candidatus Latescibacteria bacterium]|nr:hypothetical protein [Candidatus Latescibacterota bacterium]